MAPMDYLRLPLIAVAGLLIYGEALDWFVFAGAAVIVAGNFANILSERARSRQV
jgi:drug/metabolite transporter (DMT)-like permease